MQNARHLRRLTKSDQLGLTLEALKGGLVTGIASSVSVGSGVDGRGVNSDGSFEEGDWGDGEGGSVITVSSIPSSVTGEGVARVTAMEGASVFMRFPGVGDEVV
jgi:hypothetical protein